MTAVSLLMALAVSAASFRGQSFDLSKHLYKPESSCKAFAGERFENIKQANSVLEGKKNLRRAAEQAPDYEPFQTYGPTSSYGDVDGPNGEVWFYTLEKFYDTEDFEFFTEYYLRDFVLTIYNDKGEVVGTVKDKMHYSEIETRVPYCDILPVITKNFFNTTDDYEVVVAFAVNTSEKYHFEMHYRSLVYSLGGEKDDEGNDVAIFTLPEFITDVLDCSTDEKELYYMSLSKEKGGGIMYEDYGTDGFWEKYIQNRLEIELYGPAQNDQDGPAVILSYEIPLQQLPGDQESGGYLLSKVYNGQPYVILSKLREPLTEPFNDPTDENSMIQRAGNTLEIDVFKVSETATENVQHTSIPFEKVDDADVTFTFAGIGTLRGSDDVVFDQYGAGSGKIYFVVTNSNYLISSDGVNGYSFYIYNEAGTKKKTIMTNVESVLHMSDIEGFEPQLAFITNDERGYLFHFMDMNSLKKKATLSYELEVAGSDPELLTANMDRVAVGESYMYATEMRMPTEEDDQAYMRVAWFKNDASFDHIDEINMGYDIHYATCYIGSAALNPDAFHKDEAKNREYMILVKRGITDTKNQEELLIGQARSEEYPEGKTLLTVTPDERGPLSGIIPFFNLENPMLLVSFSDGRNFGVDFYRLPIEENTGISNVTVDINNAAAGVYNLQGIRVDNPGKGIFIVNGKKVLFQ